MTNVDNTVFLEEFKCLEQLCNDCFGVRNGVSTYIDEMESCSQFYTYKISEWRNDLHRLRKLRHIRNKLTHEVGTLDMNLCDVDDILWLKNFYNRIIEQNDPLSIVQRIKSAEAERKRTHRDNQSIGDFYSDLSSPKNQKQGRAERVGTALLVIIIFLLMILLIGIAAVIMING